MRLTILMVGLYLTIIAYTVVLFGLLIRLLTGVWPKVVTTEIILAIGL